MDFTFGEAIASILGGAIGGLVFYIFMKGMNGILKCFFGDDFDFFN